MQDQNEIVNSKLDRLLQLVELIVESGALRKKPVRQRVSDIPIERVDELRELEVERIFNRLANASGALKAKLNFGKAIRQEVGDPVKQIVPLSIILNRCELLKAFWPVAGSTDTGTPRDVVERYVDRFVKRKVWVRGKVSQYFPETANTRAGDTIIVLTKAEKQRLLNVEEEGDAAPAQPSAKRERKPWEDEEEEAPRPKLQWPTPAPKVTPADFDDDEDEDWDDDDEDAEPAPAAPRFTKTPPGKPRFSDEGIETGLEKPAKKSWSIGGEDGGDE